MLWPLARFSFWYDGTHRVPLICARRNRYHEPKNRHGRERNHTASLSPIFCRDRIPEAYCERRFSSLTSWSVWCILKIGPHHTCSHAYACTASPLPTLHKARESSSSWRVTEGKAGPRVPFRGPSTKPSSASTTHPSPRA